MQNYTNAHITQINAITRKTKVLTLGIMAVAALLMFGLSYTLASAAVLTSQIGPGSSGTNVTNLQAFLATNPKIYAEGLVTGFYGPLTRSAVMQFQLNYNIPPVGNVGPMTLAKVNSVMSSGLGLDISAPVISNVSIALIGNSSATVNWNTDTYATGRVFYSTQPISMSEPQIPFTQPGISGAFVENNSLFNASQNLSLQNLVSNTTYYYVVVATDASGNVSLTQQSTFHTNQ